MFQLTAAVEPGRSVEPGMLAFGECTMLLQGPYCDRLSNASGPRTQNGLSYQQSIEKRRSNEW